MEITADFCIDQHFFIQVGLYSKFAIYIDTNTNLLINSFVGKATQEAHLTSQDRDHYTNKLKVTTNNKATNFECNS